MKLANQVLLTVGELASALVSLAYVLEAIFLDGGKPAVLAAGVWLIASHLSGISKQLSKN